MRADWRAQDTLAHLLVQLELSLQSTVRAAGEHCTTLLCCCLQLLLLWQQLAALLLCC
jgi:hypothetical protein